MAHPVAHPWAFLKHSVYIIPDFKNLWISEITARPLSSPIKSDELALIYRVKILLQIHINHVFVSIRDMSLACSKGIMCALFGLKPKLESENVSSNIGVSPWLIVCCINLSTTVGIPSFWFSRSLWVSLPCERAADGISRPVVTAAVPSGFFSGRAEVHPPASRQFHLHPCFS